MDRLVVRRFGGGLAGEVQAVLDRRCQDGALRPSSRTGEGVGAQSVGVSQPIPHRRPLEPPLRAGRGKDLLDPGQGALAARGLAEIAQLLRRGPLDPPEQDRRARAGGVRVPE